MTFNNLLDMRESAFPDVQHFHPYGDRPALDIAGGPGPLGR
jgi:hypothetical protein